MDIVLRKPVKILLVNKGRKSEDEKWWQEDFLNENCLAEIQDLI